MAEGRVGMALHEDFHLMPEPVIVADFFAAGADGDQTPESANAFDGLPKFGFPLQTEGFEVHQFLHQPTPGLLEEQPQER